AAKRAHRDEARGGSDLGLGAGRECAAARAHQRRRGGGRAPHLRARRTRLDDRHNPREHARAGGRDRERRAEAGREWRSARRPEWREQQGKSRRPHPRAAGTLVAALVGDVNLSGRAPLRLVLLILLALGAATPARAQVPEFAQRRAGEQKTFTDAQIFEGFFKIAFGAEMLIAGRADRIRKYDRPVRVFAESRAL